MCNVEKNGNFMVNFVNFTPQSWQSISLKSNTKPQENQATIVSNPVSENRGTYPLTDARNVLVQPVSFKGIPGAHSNCLRWSLGCSKETGIDEPIPASIENATDWTYKDTGKDDIKTAFKKSVKVQGDEKKVGTNNYHLYKTTLKIGNENIDVEYIGSKKGEKIVKLQKVQRGKLVNNFKEVSYNGIPQQEWHDLNMLYLAAATGFCQKKDGADTAIKALEYECPRKPDMRFELKIKEKEANGDGSDSRWLCPKPTKNANGEVVFNWIEWVDKWHKGGNCNMSKPLSQAPIF